MTLRYPLRLIYVEWDDADSIARWMQPEEVDTFIASVNPIMQSGFLIHEDDQRIVLAGSICKGDDFKDDTFGNVLRIPKTWIHARRVVLTITKDGSLRFPTQKE